MHRKTGPFQIQLGDLSSSFDRKMSGENDTVFNTHFPSENKGIKSPLFFFTGDSPRFQLSDFPLTTSTQPQHDIMMLFKKKEKKREKNPTHKPSYYLQVLNILHRCRQHM